MDADRAVGIYAADRGRRRHATGPAADRDADALARSLRAVLPGRMFAHPLKAELEADAGPRVAIAHQIAGLDAVQHPELQRVDP